MLITIIGSYLSRCESQQKKLSLVNLIFFAGSLHMLTYLCMTVCLQCPCCWTLVEKHMRSLAYAQNAMPFTLQIISGDFELFSDCTSDCASELSWPSRFVGAC